MLIVEDDVRLPHVNDHGSDVALFVIGNVMAGIFRDTLDEPIPPRLAAILDQLKQNQDESPAAE